MDFRLGEPVFTVLKEPATDNNAATANTGTAADKRRMKSNVAKKTFLIMFSHKFTSFCPILSYKMNLN